MKKSPSNNKYNVHTGIDRSKDSEICVENALEKKSDTSHKFFKIKGKPDFGDLNLREYGWKIRNPITVEQKKFLEGTPGYLNYKETIFYNGPQGNAILHANYKKDSHKLKINLNSYQDENSDTMEIVKSMFEREWGCKLDDPENEDDKLEDPVFSLVQKLKSQ
jgi:hypothetical protein